MRPYIENRNGEQLDLAKPNRKQMVKLQGALLKLRDSKDDLEAIVGTLEEVIYGVLKINHDLTKEQFDDIVDYNIDTYGFAETYEMFQYIIEDVFTQVDMVKRENPYLQSKRAEKQAQVQ